MSSTSSLLGTVTQNMPGGGEARPGQLRMAEEVAALLGTPETLLIEAGTGTGKSVAYLAPIIAAGKRAVVATATIALQSQLVEKDVPLVAKALGREVSVSVLKGRSNYLCRQRVSELERASHTEQLELMGGRSQPEGLDDLLDWANDTETGDREELEVQPRFDVWRALSVGPDECPGAARCPSGENCFSEQARARALEADVIVTNHHYYGLHLATGGALLPDHDIVIFDEAHHLSDVISATCGTEVSGGRFRGLGRHARRLLTDDRAPELLDKSANDLDNALRPLRGKKVAFDTDLVALLVAGRDRADRVLGAVRKISAADGSDTAARVERVTMAATSLVNSIDTVLESDADDVVWVDGSDQSPVLRRTPLDVGTILQTSLWGERSVVLTSATLPTGIVATLGLPASSEVIRVGSTFDYAEQGMLYCATHLPEPRKPEARAAIRDEIVDLIQAAGGRTLALFTSASAMFEAAEHFREVLDVPVLAQGEQSKTALIEAFMADPRSVLAATMSFWQGVDLPGDTLTLVTIDRIPFPRPDEPVLQARRDLAGASAFRVIDLPKAQILLAQAAGRLIRRSSDRGVVAVLDTRLATNKSYRWDLINAMPELKRTRDRDEVMDFLRMLDADATEASAAADAKAR